MKESSQNGRARSANPSGVLLYKLREKNNALKTLKPGARPSDDFNRICKP